METVVFSGFPPVLKWVEACTTYRVLMMHSIGWWPTLVLVVIASIADIRTRRIPNWLVAPFLLCGLIISGVTHGWSGLAASAESILIASVLFAVLVWLGGMGMGDLKLAAAVAAWIGPAQLVVALVVMGVAGGLIAVIYSLRGGFLGETLSGAGDLIVGLGRRGLKQHPELALSNPGARKLPYAPAIAIGTIFSFLATP